MFPSVQFKIFFSKVYALLIFPSILLDMISMRILYEEYRLWGFSFGCLQRPAACVSQF